MPDGPIRVTGPLLAVLNALLEANDLELHGWAIMKATGKSGPTIYRTLERLAESNWVTSRWDTEIEPGKPRRRYYQLTGHGEASARHLIAQRQTKAAPSARTRLAFDRRLA
ncbi:PadR family transcriptional regulator [Salinispora arenicola]|uniref:PadR family transcriptional regulator n=1 Tax=Salinispora arenicola TaxID=168697 RepID=UPI00168EA849|nr:helix-turn-helix transcriptional regulator [Salinispora arenicola]NIL59779.1 PadR family transcriptional regulator [Salinispora arenicola]NIL64723.1 PadR family transcriptional regulator [Salinispora arenicola]